MRARRKKKYQARREIRAQRFWDKEVQPGIDRAFQRGVDLGRGLGRRDAERAMTCLVPNASQDEREGRRVDLDAVAERGQRFVEVPTLSERARLYGYDRDLGMQPVTFERVEYMVRVNDTRVRWLGWQPADAQMRGDLVIFPMRMAEDVVDFVLELRSRFSNGYGQYMPGGGCQYCRSMDCYLESFIAHLERRGVIVEKAGRPGRYYEPIDTATATRWVSPGGWR